MHKGDATTVAQGRDIAKSKDDADIEKASALIHCKNARVERQMRDELPKVQIQKHGEKREKRQKEK